MGRAPALLLLLAALGCCLTAASASSQACSVGGIEYRPGRFDGGAAPAMPAPGSRACASAVEVPPASKYPFWLGSATAAYQVEGAAREGGRGPSIWDVFSHTPNKVAGNQTGDEAVDFYHRFAEDIQLMRSLGLRQFRLSLAWPRLLPNGTGKLNPEGVAFYNHVIDTLIANCIQPHLTLYHWDLPQALQEAYGGWLGAQIVPDFAAYARQAFSLFGDRVKLWTTINEPLTICETGFAAGVMAPGRCSDRSKCEAGNSTTEPQLCAYHTLLAHAAAVPAFRELVPDGEISMNFNGAFYVPLTDAPADVAAADRLNRLAFGQFLDPLFFGNWTAERLQLYSPEVLPRFTVEQSRQLLAAKPDYLGLNFYGGQYGYADNSSWQLGANSTTTSAEGVPLPVAESPWLTIFPESLRGLLVWVDRRYNHTPIIVTESGVSVLGESQMPLPEALCDTFRIDYYRDYIANATAAVTEDGVDLRGYMAWSLLDNFEWADGYSTRFGINYVDFEDNLTRYYKASSLWLANQFGLTSAKSASEAVASVSAAGAGAAALLATAAPAAGR